MTNKNSPDVLIVEDEVPLSKTMMARLKLDGLNPVAAYNGEEALNLLKEKKFGAIILDLMMHKVNGFQVLEEIKQMDIDTPVIVMTVLSQPEDEWRALSLGAREYLRKGDVSLSDLSKLVKEYIEK